MASTKKEPEQDELNFKKFLERQEASLNTVKSCLTAYRLYHSLYDQLTVDNLHAYKDYLLHHYKAATVNSRIYGINRYLDCLSQTAELNIGEFRLSTIRVQQASFLDNVISQQDYETLKIHLKDSGNQFWYFVVRFLACTGARVSELVQLKAEHLYMGYMDLYSKGGKVRRIYFPDTLCREALEWIEGRGMTSGFIFTRPDGRLITPRGIGSQLKVLASRYGIPTETVYPHSFRHRFAKNFLAAFNDISLLADLMGHENIETTRIYLTPSSLEQRAMIDKIVTW